MYIFQSFLKKCIIGTIKDITKENRKPKETKREKLAQETNS